ncbi:MAG: hypothetical protein ACOYBX_13190 [Mycobacterium sp.]
MRHRLSAALVCATAAFWALGSGVAAADPDPALPDPALIGPAAGSEVPPPAALDFAAASAETKSNPTGFLTQMLAPGGISSGAAIGLSTPSPTDPLSAGLGLLIPNSYRMPAGENPYVLESGVAPGPFSRLDAFQGQHAFVHGGMGRMPGGELGVPLPGTAPLPGTNVPAGLEQYYVPPGAPSSAAPAVPIFDPAAPAG